MWIEVPTHTHGTKISNCIPPLNHTNIRDRSVFAVIRGERRRATCLILCFKSQ